MSRGRRVGGGECDPEPLAGDAEPARGAVEAEQDDLLGEWFESRPDRRNRARDARVGRPARNVMAAARGDLNAEDCPDEQHGDQRQREPPHERLRSLSASAGPSASSASPAATRKAVRNARVAARLS